jgi:hypothetical protein
MTKGSTNRGNDVDEILKDLDGGCHRGIDGGEYVNNDGGGGIDLFGIEIDDILKENVKNGRGGVRWVDEDGTKDDRNDDEDDDVAMCLPPLVSLSSMNATTTSARRPWRRTAVLALASALAFLAIMGIGYGIGYAIAGGGGNRTSSNSSQETVSSSMMEVVSDMPTYSPTLAPSSSPVSTLRSVEVVVSNDVPGDMFLYVPEGGMDDVGDDGG